MITSRRSFLVGFGALIAAPAIVHASNIMRVKQMLILPDQISDITFPIEGYARSVLDDIGFANFTGSKWSSSQQNLLPSDADLRWEMLKKREQERLLRVQA